MMNSTCGALAIGIVFAAIACSGGHTMSGKEEKQSTKEEQLVAALGSSKHPRSEIDQMVKDLPEGERLVMPTAWFTVARDSAQEPWRRLLACKLLLNRSIGLPVNFDSFWDTLVAPLGIEKRQIVDMTMASAVPVQRSAELAVSMVALPITTPTGPAALYYSVRRADGTVVDAAISPEP
jgi:hypothetical protein